MIISKLRQLYASFYGCQYHLYKHLMFKYHLIDIQSAVARSPFKIMSPFYSIGLVVFISLNPLSKSFHLNWKNSISCQYFLVPLTMRSFHLANEPFLLTILSSLLLDHLLKLTLLLRHWEQVAVTVKSITLPQLWSLILIF
jgi:hypothetical protein